MGGWRCPGNIFPTPYPQGYGATPPRPRPAQRARDVPRSMPETAPYGNAGCAVHRRHGSRAAAIGDRWNAGTGDRAAARRRPTGPLPGPAWLPPVRRGAVDDPSSGCRRSVIELSSVRRGSVAGLPTGCRRGVRPLGTDLGAARRTGRRYRARTRPAPPRPEPAAQPASPHALRSASGHPQRHRSPPPDRPRGRMEAAAPLGRAPVERMISAHATVCFQPTSFPSQSLAEMADQPPCQQAEGDRAVRFHPTGTGHERQAHFPARLTSETLRDRMLPARLPCRHKAGW